MLEGPWHTRTATCWPTYSDPSASRRDVFDRAQLATTVPASPEEIAAKPDARTAPIRQLADLVGDGLSLTDHNTISTLP
jgi:hypothetical protein